MSDKAVEVEVSLIVTAILASPLSRARAKVSVPSVLESAVTLNVNESVVPTTKLPVVDAPPMSALATPVIVNATDVPASTFSVVSVIVKLCPSLTAAALLAREKVGSPGAPGSPAPVTNLRSELSDNDDIERERRSAITHVR